MAKFESKILRVEAIPILEKEIIMRNLDNNLLEWIKLERNFFEGAELQFLKNKIKHSKCVDCGRKGNIDGFKFSYISVFNTNSDADLILCESCRKQLRNRAYKISITWGWISWISVITVPYYFLSEFYSSFKRNKTSNQIIDSFIFENTGLIRKFDLENISDLIAKHNILQRESNKNEPIIFI